MDKCADQQFAGERITDFCKCGHILAVHTRDRCEVCYLMDKLSG